MTAQAALYKRTFWQTLWYRLFRLLGWNAEYIDPGFKKYVVIVWPHTSNFDFLIGFIFSRAYPLPFPRFMAKDSMFRGPFGPLVRRLGGIPVDRSKRTNFVEQVAAEFDRNDQMIVAITPEGTRGLTQYWKTGFYYIAQAARVPIVMATIDYGRKFIRYGAVLMPTGDVDADMGQIRRYSAGVQARHPQRQGEIGVRPTEGDVVTPVPDKES